MTCAHPAADDPIPEIDSHAFVVEFFAGIPESDRVAVMERYIHTAALQRHIRTIHAACDAGKGVIELSECVRMLDEAAKYAATVDAILAIDL